MEDARQERILATVLVIIAAAIAVSVLLWMLIANYINPTTTTSRSDTVNMFILSAAGIVGSLTALAALGNLYVSRINLQQQRDLDGRRAQNDALQDYFEQMGKLLVEEDPQQVEVHKHLLSLVRAQTLTVLRRLDAQGKRDVVVFLNQVNLVKKTKPAKGILTGYADLTGADLRDEALVELNLHHTDLRNADLSKANLGSTDLHGAKLSGAVLRDANLFNVDLTDADLTGADLTGANLFTANLTRARLNGAKSRMNNLLGAVLLTEPPCPTTPKFPHDQMWVWMACGDVRRSAPQVLLMSCSLCETSPSPRQPRPPWDFSTTRHPATLRLMGQVGTMGYAA